MKTRICNIKKINMYMRGLLLLQGAFLLYLIILLIPQKISGGYTSNTLKNELILYEGYSDNKYVTVIGEFELTSGSYEIIFDLEEGKYNQELAGSVIFDSQSNIEAIWAGQTNFKYCNKSIYADVNIPLFHKVNDLCMVIYSNQKIEIDKVGIEEKYIYRITRIFIFLVMGLLVDIVIMYVCNKDITLKDKLISLGMLAIAICVSAPSLGATCYGGDDWIFHYSRIEGIAQELAKGKVPVRIYEQVNNGYGYAAPLFYGEFFLYIPAMLYNLRIPLFICGNVYIILINLLTLTFSYYSFKGVTNDVIASLVGALLYATAPYRMYCIYTRCALGEVTAMVFLPLIVLGLYRIYNDDDVGVSELWPIVLGLTGIIESHVITTEIVGIIISVLIILLIKETCSTRVIRRWIQTIIIVVGINIWFIGPFCDSLSMNIVMKQGSRNIQETGIGAEGFWGLFIKEFDGRIVGCAIIVGVLLGILLLSSARKIDTVRYEILLLSLFFYILSAFMASKFFPWNRISSINDKLAYYMTAIQFPWRYLSITELSGVIITICGISTLNDIRRKKYSVLIVGILVMAAISVGGIYLKDVVQNNPRAKYYVVNEPTFFIRMDDYLLDGTTWEDMLSDNIISGDDVTVEKVDEKYFISNSGDKDALITFPKVAYKYYKCVDENGKTLEIQNDYDYLTVKFGTKYKGSVELLYSPPVLWKIYEIVSLLTIGTLVIVAYKRNLKKI